MDKSVYSVKETVGGSMVPICVSLIDYASVWSLVGTTYASDKSVYSVKETVGGSVIPICVSLIDYASVLISCRTYLCFG